MDTDEKLNMGVLLGTKLALDALSEIELCALYNCVTAGWDVTKRPEYSKVETLFTEENGTKMHNMTRRAFELIVSTRLNQE
jgi:hypothetical protein